MSKIFLIALIAMIIFQVMGIRMQSKRSSHLTTLMDNINKEDTFFELADKAEIEEKDAEYLQKCRVIRLWADAFYNKEDDFKNTLDKIDLSVLTGKDGNVSLNEDAFFYLYLIIPHFLYTEKRNEQINLLNNKLKDVKADGTLIYNLAKENVKFYKSQPWSLTSTLLFGFYAELDGSDEIKLEDGELSVGQWMTREEIEEDENQESLTWEMIERFKHGEV